MVTALLETPPSPTAGALAAPVDQPRLSPAAAIKTEQIPEDDVATGPCLLTLELVHLGTSVRTMNTEGDPADYGLLRKLMRDAVRRVTPA